MVDGICGYISGASKALHLSTIKPGLKRIHRSFCLTTKQPTICSGRLSAVYRSGPPMKYYCSGPMPAAISLRSISQPTRLASYCCFFWFRLFTRWGSTSPTAVCIGHRCTNWHTSSTTETQTPDRGQAYRCIRLNTSSTSLQF